MYNRKINNTPCPSKIINSTILPDNISYKNITFFYKKKFYNKCYKDDLKKNIDSFKEKRYQGEMILKDTLTNIKNKYSDKIYYIINDDNSSVIKLSDENILGINYLPN